MSLAIASVGFLSLSLVMLGPIQTSEKCNHCGRGWILLSFQCACQQLAHCLHVTRQSRLRSGPQRLITGAEGNHFVLEMFDFWCEYKDVTAQNCCALLVLYVSWDECLLMTKHKQYSCFACCVNGALHGALLCCHEDRTVEQLTTQLLKLTAKCCSASCLWSLPDL